MLTFFSAGEYQSRETNNTLLLPGTGHKPGGAEIDSSIIYAGYYSIEALLRAKKNERR